MLVDGIIQLMTGQGSIPSKYAAQVAAVGGLLGTDDLDRVTVYEGELPRGYKLPAVAVHQYNGNQDSDFSGPVDDREDFIQFDIYGSTAVAARTLKAAIRALFVGSREIPGFLGTLPDGTVVEGIFLERDMDLPFLPHADQKGIANRTTLGIRVTSAA